MSALHEVLAAEGGLLGDALAADCAPPADAVAGAAAAGPRAAGAPAEYALLVAAVREGHRLHAGAPEVITGADPDLALLGGDRLYALGLDRLARLGDLEAVGELADAISLCALAQAGGAPDLAAAAWDAAAAGVGWGGHPELAAAKAAARTGDPGAADRLRTAADLARANVARAEGENGTGGD